MNRHSMVHGRLSSLTGTVSKLHTRVVLSSCQWLHHNRVSSLCWYVLDVHHGELKSKCCNRIQSSTRKSFPLVQGFRRSAQRTTGLCRLAQRQVSINYPSGGSYRKTSKSPMCTSPRSMMYNNYRSIHVHSMELTSSCSVQVISLSWIP